MVKLEKNEFFIPGNVPSLKNSKIKTSRGVFASKTVTKYLKLFGIKSYCTENTTKRNKNVELYKRFEGSQYIEYFPDEDLKKMNILRENGKPIEIGFHFIRGSKHKFDFVNACQIICDLMSAYDIIEDDNMDYLIPFPHKKNDLWYSYDKDNPGVIIKIY